MCFKTKGYKGVTRNTYISMSGHIYILCEREFAERGTPIYKVGRTTNINRRFSQYPKGSEMLLSVRVGQVNETEKQLLGIFRTDYIARTDIGSEYFEGDVLSMMQTAMLVAALNLSSLEFPISMEPALKEVHDPSLVVIEFVKNNLEELSNQVHPSGDVYARLCEWVDEKRYNVKLTHNTFTKELMSNFKVRNGVHRFSTGLNRALYFPDLTPPKSCSCTILRFIEHVFSHLDTKTDYKGQELFDTYQIWLKDNKYIDHRGSCVVMVKLQDYGNEVPDSIVKRSLHGRKIYIFSAPHVKILLEKYNLLGL